MTSDDFEELKRRFGNDIAAWPAPFRQQALNMSIKNPGQDDELDWLVLEAALLETDEGKVARQVLARINADRGSHLGLFLSGILLKPAAMAACGALLLVALATGGYQMAASQGDPFDVQLLALAAGAPLGNDLIGLSADDGSEGAL
ncbi:hypothetical protein LB566_26885 [Mesorhizobium sp. CA13]|uniref:hypothetical protein n=1 Tax=unclassified Mesorhizobium TaxID=325217 RepID=UPI001127473B|nr:MULTISPECIES: hypothetical protein [unclassified Mesorhizobium]MBZ9857416.1 hypothetical protein [Mesorhizobium sp. CA13]MBZ9921842.1 hypothetical protein [Mesorhizobium sp. BR1-1-7]MBZ9966624.1 hypothetical protein [Mesorhizobium sp. BR1-1-2]MCA0014784.1 hypothetical protein [Mesorhizobium sp. B294B1A1]MCA0041095.1 hypothetical protein [Mesorhizobium sp. B292B1B]